MHKCLQHLLWLIVRSLISTYKIEVQGTEFRDKARTLGPHKSFIFALWHEQVISVMTGHAWTEPFLTLASRSKDGDYAAFVSEKMGYVSVRGSSRRKHIDKGGKEALMEYIAGVNKGISGGMTVDGPRGPRQKCKPGVVIVARDTGSPVLPVVAIANRYWEFNSWDRFKIPKPFAKIIMLYGEPISIESGASNERVDEVCAQVTESLKALEQKVLQGNS
jgi:lysophospholipid acyltransferase (LPLAT)-like uncharacterized protein